MQSLEWHGQHPLAKWYAITSSIGVALLAIVAGILLLSAERITAEYDMPISSTFVWLASYGLASVIAAWALHLAGLVLLLGYNHTAHRTWACLAMTGLATLILMIVATSSLSALPLSGTKSLM